MCMAGLSKHNLSISPVQKTQLLKQSDADADTDFIQSKLDMP